jgi:pimeloyl-ACP methyl ester carboxylesterase
MATSWQLRGNFNSTLKLNSIFTVKPMTLSANVEPAIKRVQCLSPAGLHAMAYKEWGDPHNPRVLVCVHGVTRVSGDFDDLARALCDSYRVICPDVVGRGRSDWLRNPQFYVLPQYVSDMVTLLARADADSVDWVGTSMGGLIGIGLAGLEGSPIRRLVINDVGPTLNHQALERIGAYIGFPARFDSREEAERYIRDISAPFGPHTEAQWSKLAADVLKQDADGKWTRHYDPQLAAPFKHTSVESTAQAQALLWASYDAIRCPTLLLRGAESDLLTKETAQEMMKRGPRAELVEIAGVGHAPTLVQQDQVDIVRKYLLG